MEMYPGAGTAPENHSSEAVNLYYCVLKFPFAYGRNSARDFLIGTYNAWLCLAFPAGQDYGPRLEIVQLSWNKRKVQKSEILNYKCIGRQKEPLGSSKNFHLSAEQVPLAAACNFKWALFGAFGLE